MSVLEAESLRLIVIDTLVSLGYRQRGSEIFLHCPWHQEKTPSLSCHVGYKLRPGSFHCFGCGEKGDWTKLFSAISGKAPIQQAVLTPTAVIERPRLGDAPDVGRMLNGLFGSLERDDLPRRIRGVEEIPKGFEWRGLNKKFLDSIGAGLYFDAKTLEEYLHFPLTMSGDYLGYTLSHLNRREGCNIPKHAVYAKSKRVLMMYDHVGYGDRFVLTEGHFDVLRLLSAGIPAMAILGVENWSEEKAIRVINKLPPKLVVLMDGDDPGYAAARKVYTSLAGALPVEIIDFPRMPQGVDKIDAGNMPDEWINYVKARLYAN